MKKVPSYKHLQEARLIFSRWDKEDGNPKCEFEVYVAGIDFKVGITLKVLDIETFNETNSKYNYSKKEDGEVCCLSRKAYENKNAMKLYTDTFIYFVHCIEAGYYDRERGIAKVGTNANGPGHASSTNMISCAFL